MSDKWRSVRGEGEVLLKGSGRMQYRVFVDPEGVDVERKVGVRVGR